MGTDTFGQLLQTITVLKLNDTGTHLGNQVEFLSDEDGRDTSMLLDRSVWNEMGRPSKITLTILPGDTLND